MSTTVDARKGEIRRLFYRWTDKFRQGLKLLMTIEGSDH